MNEKHDKTEDRFDEPLEALLDDALGPESVPGGVPADLTEKIVGATAPRLRRGVLARIGRSTVWRVAAVAAIVCGAAALWMATSSRPPTGDWAQQVESQLARITAQDGPGQAPIDQQLALLDAEIDLVMDVEDQWSRELASVGGIDDPWAQLNDPSLF